MFLQSTRPDATGWQLAYFFYGGNYSRWNNNDAAILGRVMPGQLAAGSLGGWQFFCGNASGPASEARWCAREGDAVPVLEYEKMLGENLVSHDAASGRYLMANYGFYRGDTNEPYSWFSKPVRGRRWSQLVLLEAPNAWGPWSVVHLEDDWRGVGAGYTPTLPTAWMQPWQNGQLRVAMVHSGFWEDYNFAVSMITLNASTTHA